MNLDLVSLTSTAPGTGATMAAVSGDSLTVRNGAEGSPIHGLAFWTKAQAVGTTQIVWPSGHDLVRGFRYRNVANDPGIKSPAGYPAQFRAQDPLTATQVGSATAGDVETAHVLMFYEDLPGIDAHMINLATLRKRGVNILTVEDTVTATAAGSYSGARALNAASDLMKANTDYALIGGIVGVVGGAITVRGTDTGNLRCGFPAVLDPIQTNNFFLQLSELYGIPCIPTFNSANKASTFIELVQDENLTAVPFSLNFVELSK